MTPETRYARTADGTHVAYQVNGDGPVDILVLRTWYSNLDHEWADPVLAGIYRRLGAIGRVVRLDRRGTGQSDRFDHAEPPTVEHRVDDMRAVLDAVDSRRVVLIGLAHGAALCAIFAATYPERTAGLVFWSPPGLILGQYDPDRLAEYVDAMTRSWATTELAREIAEAAGPSRADDEDFVEWIRLDQQLSGTPADARAQLALVASTNVDAILPALNVPTLVLWREGAPFAARHVAERVPHATAVELPGRDHVFIAGDWRPGLAEMERFIERVADLDPDDDRVLATVLFTDLVGSTELVQRLGDRRWRELLDRHHAEVRRELTRFRGREIDTAGDGFFASFDAPARAIRCAIAVRSAVQELGLELRIGIHAGECERAGTGLRGVAVHLGARIGAMAGAGEVLVSSTVRDLVAGSGFAFEEAGRHRLKGIEEPVQVYRVVEPANPD